MEQVLLRYRWYLSSKGSFLFCPLFPDVKNASQCFGLNDKRFSACRRTSADRAPTSCFLRNRGASTSSTWTPSPLHSSALRWALQCKNNVQGTGWWSTQKYSFIEQCIEMNGKSWQHWIYPGGGGGCCSNPIICVTWFRLCPLLMGWSSIFGQIKALHAKIFVTRPMNGARAIFHTGQ